MKLSIALLVGIFVFAEGNTDFEGSQVLSITISTQKQLELLKQLGQDANLDFWTSPKLHGIADVMVSSSQKEYLTALFSRAGIKWSVKINNVKSIVEQQKRINDRAIMKSDDQMSWTAYHRYDTIIAWLDSIASNDLVTLTVIGKTVEGRDIHQVKISTGLDSNGQVKPVVFIDANFHAREWVTHAATTWIINEIVSNSDNYGDILSRFDLVIVPLANPDGYEFTHETDRLWRKNRSINPNTTCVGTDLNRNFDYFFGGENSSDDPCNIFHRGPEPFSELESRAVRDAITNLQTETVVHAYYTIHSYGQVFLLSWGHSYGAYPEDFSELLTWGINSVAAITDVHQALYTTGQGAEILYPMGGCSYDWAKAQGVKYTTTIEVRDTGDYGFLLPAEQIIPTAEEIWAGIQVIASTTPSR